MSIRSALPCRCIISACAALAMLGAALPATGHEFQVGALTVVHPHARATPEGAKVGAGYFTVRNEGGEADRLVSADCECAGRTEIHEMVVNAEGVMKMSPLAEGLPVEANGEVALEPGSYHIMFMELNHGLEQGESVSGTLTFEKAGTVEIEYSVEGMSMDGHGGHHGS